MVQWRVGGICCAICRRRCCGTTGVRSDHTAAARPVHMCSMPVSCLCVPPTPFNCRVSTTNACNIVNKSRLHSKRAAYLNYSAMPNTSIQIQCIHSLCKLNIVSIPCFLSKLNERHADASFSYGSAPRAPIVLFTVRRLPATV